MTEIAETELPGIGLRHEFSTHAGRRLGLVTHRSGQRDFLLYSKRDPDSCEAVITLDEQETDILAGLLGAPKIAHKLEHLPELVPGLLVEQLPVQAGSQLAGLSLAQSRARTLTEASIAAVLHNGDVTAAPGPETVLAAGDVVVAVGSPRAVEALATLLSDREG